MNRSHGATVWFTGLPGAGKTTLASAVERALLSSDHAVYRLDGDELRRTICADLGFDRAARGENVRRVAHIARMLADAGVIALVALISPYESDRAAARQLHQQADLRFIEVHVDTPVEVCRQRDPKGLYAGAMAGDVHLLTGVDDPYEPPEHPELRLGPQPLEDSVRAVLDVLARDGVLTTSSQ
jgi:adenylyl-sulfate kinase